MKNYIKLITLIVFSIFLKNDIKAQSHVSFFHLGDYVQQSTELSPVYLPKNKLSIGLPGVSVAVSNQLSYRQIFPQNLTNPNFVDFDMQGMYNAIDGEYNNFAISQSVNLFNLAFKRKHGSITFFVNQKVNTNWKMSKNGVLNILNNGLQKRNNTILLNDQIDATLYAEAGIGFTQQFLKDKLAVGIKLKYLIGVANGSTQENATASVRVNNDYSWTINTKNAFARSAGIDLENIKDYKFNTNNTGIGFDIGASYEIIPNLIVEAAINDIGAITWKDNVKEYYVNDVTNLEHEGTNLRSDNDVLDDLEALTESGKLDTGERKGTSYKTSLATTSYLSASYSLFKKHQFRATMFNNHKLKDDKAVLGLGYNLALRKTTYGVVGIKNAQGEIDYGVNFATKIGPIQIYAATDNLNKILGKPEEVRNANLKLGLNLVFGYGKKSKD